MSQESSVLDGVLVGVPQDRSAIPVLYTGVVRWLGARDESSVAKCTGKSRQKHTRSYQLMCKSI